MAIQFVVAGVIGRYLLKHGIKKATKKFGKKAVEKVSKMRPKDGKYSPKLFQIKTKPKNITIRTVKKPPVKFKLKTKPTKKMAEKALEYSPPYMLRTMMRDAIAKKTPKKRITPLIKKLAVGGGIFTSGALTGAAYEKGKKYKKSKKKSKKKEEK